MLLGCGPGPGAAQHCGEVAAPRLCVALLVVFFLLCVGFFLGLFHRNSCNKDLVFSWCSDVAGGMGWTFSFLSLGQGLALEPCALRLTREPPASPAPLNRSR